MSQDNLIKLECTAAACGQINYHTQKNKKKLKNRLEMMKYCKHCRKRTKHKETK